MNTPFRLELEGYKSLQIDTLKFYSIKNCWNSLKLSKKNDMMHLTYFISHHSKSPGANFSTFFLRTLLEDVLETATEEILALKLQLLIQRRS